METLIPQQQQEEEEEEEEEEEDGHWPSFDLWRNIAAGKKADQ